MASFALVWLVSSSSVGAPGPDDNLRRIDESLEIERRTRLFQEWSTPETTSIKWETKLSAPVIWSLEATLPSSPLDDRIWRALFSPEVLRSEPSQLFNEAIDELHPLAPSIHNSRAQP